MGLVGLETYANVASEMNQLNELTQTAQMNQICQLQMNQMNQINQTIRQNNAQKRFQQMHALSDLGSFVSGLYRPN
jgi:hypothetical protein